MVNSASAALAEFKNQRLGSITAGSGSMVDSPAVVGSSLSDSFSSRMSRSAPKKSSTIALDQIRKNGVSYHNQAMMGYAAKREAQKFQGLQDSLRQGRTGTSGYQLPAKGGGGYTGENGRLGPRGGGGAYGLTVPASNAFQQMSAAAQQAGVGGLSVNDGYRDIEGQNQAWADYQNGGNVAAQPGTSVHGWGQAVDLGGGGGNYSSAQHAWLRQNAANFKWFWVGQNFGEDWHWEYRPEW